MKVTLLLLHLFISIGLVILILLQSGKGGLGRAFGGDVVYRSKRGAEKVVFIATFVFAVLFLITSIVNMLVK
jgi:preprotein translocase subunit SecG